MTKFGKLRAIDLCCGAGGWAFAARGLPIEFLAVADIAADCLETWRTNHAADHPAAQRIACDLSDAGAVDRLLDQLNGAGVDVVLGGIPCEQVSIIRQSPADNETMEAWYALIDTCFAVVDRLKPAAWCFEDVIQIERHLPLPLWRGSEIPTWRCNAADFGPQSRVRTFLGDFPRPAPRWVAERTLAQCLRPGPHLTIANNDEFERLQYPGRAISLLAGEKTARVLSPFEPSPTVVSVGPHRGQRQRRNWMVADERDRLRVLSLQEFARLQGFPDDALFACGACRAQEMVGQAIPIYVGRAILEEICQRCSA